MGAEVAIVSMVAGTVMQAYGAHQGAKAQKNAANYQAAVARNNAQVAEWQAEDALRRGEMAKQRAQLNTANLKGRQRAMLAERGIDLGEGSALNLLTDTDQFGAMDAGTVTDNANREAYGFRVGAQNSSANAELLQYKADSTSPGAAAAGSLLTGAGQVASSWYTFSSKGNDPFGIKFPGSR
jgi:hypothetical protein